MEFLFDGNDCSELQTIELNGLRFARWSDLRAHRNMPMARGEQWIGKVDDWLANTITQSHADLGRKGAICPYVKRAPMLDGIIALAVRGAASSPSQWLNLVRRSQIAFQRFQTDCNHVGLFSSLLIIAPDLEPAQADKLFVHTLDALKTQFVRSG